jgi:hypothetical protein
MEQYWNTYYYQKNNLPTPMFVIGYIDSYGAIEARLVTIDDVSLSHTRELSRGRRWRWCIPEQEYMAPRGRSELTDEECFLVEDWLEKNGYMVPRYWDYQEQRIILPEDINVD